MDEGYARATRRWQRARRLIAIGAVVASANVLAHPLAMAPFTRVLTMNGRTHPELYWYLGLRFGIGVVAVALTLVLLWRTAAAGARARTALVVTLASFPVALLADLALTLFLVFIGGLIDGLNSIDGSSPETDNPALGYLLVGELLSNLTLCVLAVFCAVLLGTRPTSDQVEPSPAAR